MSLLPTITALGFALLTALFFGLVLRNLRNVLQLTNWTNQRQRKIQTGALLIIIGWAVLVAIASISGYTQRFDWFPINLGPILIIPLVGILILTFSKGTADPLRIFHNEPANTIVAEFPFIFLPTFLVPLAYGLHFLSLRKLTAKL